MLAIVSKGDNNKAESIILTLYYTLVQPYPGGCVGFAGSVASGLEQLDIALKDIE